MRRQSLCLDCKHVVQCEITEPVFKCERYEEFRYTLTLDEVASLLHCSKRTVERRRNSRLAQLLNDIEQITGYRYIAVDNRAAHNKYTFILEEYRDD